MTRLARQHRYEIPDRIEIRRIFVDVIEERMSFEEVSDWAGEFVLFDNPQIYPEIEDEVILAAILKLFGSDSKISETESLHSKKQFLEWLKEFDEQCG